MTIEQRKEEFIKLCQMANPDITEDFIEYWTEHSINGKKMRYEKETVFDIKRRWGTWQRNNIKFNRYQPVKSNPISDTMNAFDNVIKRINNQ